MSADQISIIIVEDEPEFRRRFAQIIENEPTMRLAGVAANKREAQALIEENPHPKLRIHIAHVRPDVNPGTVRVAVSAASLNYGDIARCRGGIAAAMTRPYAGRAVQRCDQALSRA